MSDEEPAAVSPHVIYLSDEDKQTLASIADVQEISGGVIVRKIFDDYLDGKLAVEKEEFVKTSVWMERDRWAQLRAKTTAEKIPISRVLAAGIQRLRGR